MLIKTIRSSILTSILTWLQFPILFNSVPIGFQNIDVTDVSNVLLYFATLYTVRVSFPFACISAIHTLAQ